MKQVKYPGGLGVSQEDMLLGNEVGRVSKGPEALPADMLLGIESGRVSWGVGRSPQQTCY